MFSLAKPRIICKDGFSMSVQDGEHHYAKWGESYEVGFPSEREELLMPYVEDPDYPTETVYAYVPKAVVSQVISKHGGIDGQN
ncbi:MAG: hypothetical protein Unbinned4409contig1002_2 [Prokaryotic dsDNA virus sp.]|nr:MAG: hypothetical protein Unbinned4409contig1002_2 [Prokaryotic dsDNA virus sp.]|tara:strand:+ start:1321 stop:1569 length:249 start_codon:yes stop_codon:yes gene_type:complete